MAAGQVADPRQRPLLKGRLGMNWGLEDLIAACALLFGAGLALAIIFKTVRAAPARVFLSGAVALISLAVWAHLAVGLF